MVVVVIIVIVKVVVEGGGGSHSLTNLCQLLKIWYDHWQNWSFVSAKLGSRLWNMVTSLRWPLLKTSLSLHSLASVREIVTFLLDPIHREKNILTNIRSNKSEKEIFFMKNKFPGIPKLDAKTLRVICKCICLENGEMGLRKQWGNWHFFIQNLVCEANL